MTPGDIDAQVDRLESEISELADEIRERVTTIQTLKAVGAKMRESAGEG